MPQYYYQDGINARRNLVTIVGEGGPAYNAILSEPIIEDEQAAPNAVTLEEAKMWCSIDGDDRDDEITSIIDEARDIVEREINKSLVYERSITVKIKNDLGGITLPLGPVIDGSLTAIDSDETDLEDYSIASPSVTGEITVTYDAGYEGPIPARYRNLWKNKILELFDNRGKK